jgi:transmembrane sensor
VANATDSLFAAVREAQDDDLHLADANEHARARARLLQAVDRTESAAHGRGAPAKPMPAPVMASPRRPWRFAIGGLAAAACAFAVLFALPERSEPEVDSIEMAVLEFQIEGGPLSSRPGDRAEVAANQTILADEQARVLLVSDSTRIQLAPHGIMSIEEIRSNGATVLLEQGELTLDVHHEDDTSWRVAAGPWTVHVTGTQFVVAWEPSAEHFRVAVSEGSVRVEGPEGQIAQLRAGEELVRARGKATIEPETFEDVAALEQPLEASDSGQIDEPIKAKQAARRWDRYFDDADYDGAWDTLAGQPGGILGEAERVKNPGTLLDLADVARFTKHSADTRKLLELLRDRFPDTTESGDAAFALGRLAADAGSHAKAAVWFERYLDERAGGSFAGDALGRLIDCYDALGQTDDAKSAAKRYLAGYPKGPHAAKAEKILGQ